jgi:regulator of protease activity HflC (stomatin/prohibitin superfamily)
MSVFNMPSGARTAPSLSKIPNSLIWGVLGVLIVLALIISSGQTIQPGNVGVKIRTLGPEAGVAAQSLTSGWRFNLPGERIVEFPVIQRTYAYNREADERGAQNEEIVFADNTGLPMTADVSITIQVQPQSAPSLYEKYRLTFDQLLDGPIRNDVRSAVAAETEKVGVEVLYSGGRQAVIQRALATVSRKWNADGVAIAQMDWIGAIRYPTAIIAQMENKTRLEQEALAAKSLEAKAIAEASAKVAAARGEAESIRIINEALARNPQYVQLKAIEKWDGKLPQVTGSATPFVNVNPAN